MKHISDTQYWLSLNDIYNPNLDIHSYNFKYVDITRNGPWYLQYDDKNNWYLTNNEINETNYKYSFELKNELDIFKCLDYFYDKKWANKEKILSALMPAIRILINKNNTFNNLDQKDFNFMNFDGIELSKLFGGYEIVNIPATSLPQELATALSTVNQDLLGATYIPIWYVGKQIVNGTNYKLICRQIKTTKNQNQAIVALTVNIPNGGHGETATVVDITEEVSLNEDLQYAFDMAIRPLVGAMYKPLAYIGKQIVKGTNYYFICSTKRVHPGSVPYPTVVCVNQFDGVFMVVSIEPLIPQVESNGKSLNAPLGEWP